MALHRRPDGSVEIREQWALLRWACGLGSVLIVILAVGNTWIDTNGRWSGAAGAIAGGGVLALVALLAPRLHVVFDAAKREVRWTIGNTWRTRTGIRPFSDIRDVLVTTESDREDDDRAGGFRTTFGAVLRMTEETVPLTATRGTDRTPYDALVATVSAAIAGMPSDVRGLSGRRH